jgi:hypothetical protein
MIIIQTCSMIEVEAATDNTTNETGLYPLCSGRRCIHQLVTLLSLKLCCSSLYMNIIYYVLEIQECCACFYGYCLLAVILFYKYTLFLCLFCGWPVFTEDVTLLSLLLFFISVLWIFKEWHFFCLKPCLCCRIV